ncbi:MAG TPA: hypothetical protein VEF04_19800, partial [Blastocatellia bacterium]|nr:hypothetical protein [Blastocatellia bacterium]
IEPVMLLNLRRADQYCGNKIDSLSLKIFKDQLPWPLIFRDSKVRDSIGIFVGSSQRAGIIAVVLKSYSQEHYGLQHLPVGVAIADMSEVKRALVFREDQIFTKEWKDFSIDAAFFTQSIAHDVLSSINLIRPLAEIEVKSLLT